jgi:hypothetical protein
MLGADDENEDQGSNLRLAVVIFPGRVMISKGPHLPQGSMEI